MIDETAAPATYKYSYQRAPLLITFAIEVLMPFGIGPEAVVGSSSA
jgi:hypothetical protein